MRDKNYVRLGQIYQFLQKLCKKSINTLSLENFETLICNDFDVNYQVPIDSLICQNKPEYSGNTALHFVAERCEDFDTNRHYQKCIKLLIKYGADVTIKNTNGLTPLLLAFKETTKRPSKPLPHFNGNNTINIRSKNGISHFHVLCTTNNFEKVELFLKSGIDINERVNDDSPEYPGYTPLHFAAHYLCTEIIKLLMRYGADLYVSDARGMSPIHLIAENYLMKFNCHNRKIVIIETFEIRIFVKITILKSYLSYSPDNLGFSRFHYACLVIDKEASINKYFDENFDIDSPIDFDSPIWPGRTPLHLAAEARNLEIIKFLLEKGANIFAKDANGTTAFDVIFKCFSKVDEMIDILSSETRHKLPQLQLTDGTYLLDVMQALKDKYNTIESIKKNLKTVNTFVPLNSPLWPGYNLLHLHVLFSYRLDVFMELDIDFSMINADGMSPFHIVFRKEKFFIMSYQISEFILKMPKNIVDRDNLSHLHIACAESDEMAIKLKAVKCILKNGADPNISTINDIWYQRHCRYDCGYEDIVMKSGTTPLHIAISGNNIPSANILLSYGANPCIADAAGVTPFQIALIKLTKCVVDKSVKKLIARMFKSHGKDLMTGDKGVKILRTALSVLNNKYTDLLKKMITEFDCEKRHEELGLTKLQIACALGDFNLIKKELESGAADVNARIAFDSSLWPGYTALHILLKKFRRSKDHYIIIDLLLKHGADISLKNAENLTPFHLGVKVYDRIYCRGQEGLLFEHDSFLSKYNFAKVNPINNEGLSHFHLCCMGNNINLIEEFLKSGVDVNTSVDYFAKNFAGYTPLHILVDRVRFDNVKIFELLLSYDADPCIFNAAGLNACHVALQNDDITKKVILRSNVDVYSSNIFGDTALDMTIKKYLFSIDEWDTNQWRYEICHKHVKNMVQWGYELCHKDIKGKTALHKFTHPDVIKMLLSLGADINIRDDNGKTCVQYVSVDNRTFKNLYDDDIMEFILSKVNRNLEYIFVEHIHLLQTAGVYVDDSNKIFYNSSVIKNFSYILWKSENIKLERVKLGSKLKKLIDPSFSANYFLSEKFVVDYKIMPVILREKIYNFCISNDLSDFKSLSPLIMLQFWKARARSRLFKPAEYALQALINRPFPDCIEPILNYLKNDDLMNLVRIEYGKLVFSPLSEDFWFVQPEVDTSS